MSLENYKCIAKSLTLLLEPLVEVVIHEIASNTIVCITGSLSKRQVGDPSLIAPEELDNLLQQVSENVYLKVSDQGDLLKSISIPLRQEGSITYLMCINCNISVFQQMEQMAQMFLNSHITRAQPTVLFKNDWQERLHKALYEHLEKRKQSLHQLTNKQKKQFIKTMYEQGAFSEKHAADYIARMLGMGRATIFNYLREWKHS